MQKELKYRIIMFKLAGHQTWRITTEASFKDVKNVTEKKTIVIDRLSGNVVVVK